MGRWNWVVGFVSTNPHYLSDALGVKHLVAQFGLTLYLHVRLGLISRRHENQQKVWNYKYTI
jgi:hypothetical protein